MAKMQDVISVLAFAVPVGKVLLARHALTDAQSKVDGVDGSKAILSSDPAAMRTYGKSVAHYAASIKALPSSSFPVIATLENDLERVSSKAATPFKEAKDSMVTPTFTDL